jgi:hypothetical protein
LPDPGRPRIRISFAAVIIMSLLYKDLAEAYLTPTLFSGEVTFWSNRYFIHDFSGMLSDTSMVKS